MTNEEYIARKKEVEEYEKANVKVETENKKEETISISSLSQLSQLISTLLGVGNKEVKKEVKEEVKQEVKTETKSEVKTEEVKVEEVKPETVIDEKKEEEKIEIPKTKSTYKNYNQKDNIKAVKEGKMDPMDALAKDLFL